MMENGSREKQEVKVSKYFPTELYLKVNGKNLNFSRVNVSSLTLRSTMATGTKENRRAMGLKRGRMEDDTKDRGSKESQLVKESKPTKMDLPNAESGQVAYSPYLEMLMKKITWTSRNLEKKLT